MTARDVATASQFRKAIADLLGLLPSSGDAEVREALQAKGPDFVVWYDMRLHAIAESRSLDRRLQRARSAARHCGPQQ